MPKSTLQKLEDAFMKAQTVTAKILGTPRIHVLKTEKMSEKTLDNYRDICDELIRLTKIAKDIEDSANTGELKKVANMARKCKIDIKSEFEKFVKDMNKTTGDIRLGSGHLDTSRGAIKDLLTKMREPVMNMLKIHNTCVTIYNALGVPEKLATITTEDAKPSAPTQY